MSTQSVAGAGPPTVLRDSQSEFPNNQATICEEIPKWFQSSKGKFAGMLCKKVHKNPFLPLSSVLLADKVHTLKL